MDSPAKTKVLQFLNSKGEIPGATEEEQLRYAYLENRLIDSMGIIEMVVEFESQFGIQFSPDHMSSQEFQTVGGLIALIERLQAESR
jgi:acyl carrier protein